MNMQPLRTRRWRLPLHIPVAVLFSLLILGVGSAITVYHFHETRLLLESANGALFRALTDRARETVENANRAVQRSFILLAASPLNDAGTFAERLRFLPELTGLMEADPLIDSIMVGYGNGDFFLLRHGPSASKAAWQVIHVGAMAANVAPTVQLSDFDQALRLIGGESLTQAFEPRSTTWYRRAAADDQAVVMPPQVLPFGSEVAMTFARRNGAEVVGVNVGLSNLSRMLGSMPMTAGTRLRLVSSDGRTLTSPTNAIPPPRLSRHPAPSPVSPVTDRVLDAQGQAWRVSSAPIGGFGRNDWQLVVETPETELLADAYRLRESSIHFTLMAVLFSFPLAWALSRLLTTPLHRLAHLARVLSSLQFQPQPQTHSIILEVDQLGHAMTIMRRAIARFLEMGRDLGSARDVDSVLREVAASAREISGATWAAVAIADDAYSGTPKADRAEFLTLAAALADAEGPASLVAPLTDLPDTHVLGVPLKTPDGEPLGTLLLADHRARHHGIARSEVAGFLVALAGTAAVALENQRLLKGRKDLLRGVISMVAEAIDAKSPYTGGHCRRVTAVARRLAAAAHQTRSGPLADYRLDDAGWEALEIASWLHDCGKLTTPEYVIDKATKLETLYNRIHEIRTRFEVLKRDADIAYWRGLAEGGDAIALRQTRDATWQSLDADFAFVASCNLGSEGMPPDVLERLDRIAAQTWARTLDNRLGLSRSELERLEGLPRPTLPAVEPLLADNPAAIIARSNRALFEPDNPWGFVMDVPPNLYNHGELYNLKIQRGTLTDEERFKIKEHIVQTIVMLARLPFPRELTAVPEMASAHHETLDGRGYPRRLQASQMSITARIMAIADIYEALTAPDRPYRKPTSPAEAMGIMHDFCNRKVIDPDLFAIFVDHELWRDQPEPRVQPTYV